MGSVGELLRAASEDFAVDTMLTRLCGVASSTLPVDGVGVMGVTSVGGRPGRTRLVRADAATRRLELLQESLQTGPCRDAADTGVTVVVPDLTVEGRRWPRMAAEAAGVRLRSVVAVPLVSRGRVWGVLDLYREAAGGWDGDDLAAVRILADVAASYVVVAYDRDLARVAQAELTDRYLHDQLTGLPNRVLLVDRVVHALAEARRSGMATGVFFLDVDRFKQVNDTFGHAAGDAVLTEVAARLAAAVRPGDTLARLAGDEFVLVCPALPHPSPDRLAGVVDGIVGRLRAALAAPVPVPGVGLALTMSIGVSVTTESPTVRDLLDDADVAMYAAKAQGPGRAVVRDHVFGCTLGYGRQLRRDLAEALVREQLRVHYQPITTVDGTVVAVEALTRWEHPEHGLLPAAAFIHLLPTAVPQLSHWVLAQAAAQLAAWRAQLGRRAPGLVLVNLSGVEIVDPRLLRVLAETLNAHGLEPGDIGLEIVEDAFTDPTTLGVLEQLHRLGHPLAVDDFGTGYSSLSRLVTLPVAYVKIDHRFVAGLPADSRSAALVDAVLVVAAHLGIQVIAEGVETAAHHDHLTAAGAGLFQGHHIAPALPASEITALIADRTLSPIAP